MWLNGRAQLSEHLYGTKHRRNERSSKKEEKVTKKGWTEAGRKEGNGRKQDGKSEAEETERGANPGVYGTHSGRIEDRKTTQTEKDAARNSRWKRDDRSGSEGNKGNARARKEQKRRGEDERKESEAIERMRSRCIREAEERERERQRKGKKSCYARAQTGEHHTVDQPPTVPLCCRHAI